MNRSLLFALAIVAMSIAPGLAQPPTYEDPEKAVLAYLQYEIERGKADNGVWNSYWCVERPTDAMVLNLATPYRVLTLARDDVEDFASSGSFVKSAGFVERVYPVFDGSRLIGYVRVTSSPAGWQWSGQAPANSKLNGRATTLTNEGYDVSIVRGYKLGLFLLATKAKEKDQRLYPWNDRARGNLEAALGAREYYPLKEASSHLVPVAERVSADREEAREE